MIPYKKPKYRSFEEREPKQKIKKKKSYFLLKPKIVYSSGFTKYNFKLTNQIDDISWP